MLRWLGAILAGLLAMLPGSAAGARQPNIILIMADDLGLGDVGAFGATRIRTPHIDALARQGARLDNFFASANVCTPSRAGLLTGRYAARSGLAVGVAYPHTAYGLPASVTTLPGVLRNTGYRTAMLGKWHLGASDAAWPLAHGFDQFWGVPWSNDMKPLPLFRDRTIIEPVLSQETFARRMAEEAKAVIAAPSDKPFFLYVAPTAPHVPLRPGPAFAGRSDAGAYADSVEELDWTVGQISAAVKAAGKDRDTIIIFTSDNGPWWEGSAGNRRGNKGGSFEGGYAVPLAVRWPGNIRPGVHSSAIAMNIDFLPTLAKLAGAALPASEALDGRDIWALFEGSPKSPHETLLFFANDQIAAIRNQQYRLVVSAYYLTYFAPLEKAGYPLLFDMAADPGERFSVAGRHPEIVKSLKAELEAAQAVFSAMPQQRSDPFSKAPAILPSAVATPRR